MTNEKHFPKTIKQWELDYVWVWVCLQIYRELLSLATFLRVHSNSKEVSYLWELTPWKISHICRCTLKVYIDKQLLLITKSEYKEVNIKSEQTITYSKSPIENTRKRWEWCSKLTIKTLGRHHLAPFTYLPL